MNNFSLEELTKYLDVHLKSKNNEDLDDAKLRRFKEKWLFISMLFSIAVTFIVCILILFKSNAIITGIALNGIIGLTLALSGYYVRGKSI